MSSDTPTVVHSPLVVGRGQHDPGHRARGVPAVQDAHLVVDQADVGQRRVDLGQPAAQRLVQRVHRADALADGHHPVGAQAQPDDGLAAVAPEAPGPDGGARSMTTR